MHVFTNWILTALMMAVLILVFVPGILTIGFWILALVGAVAIVRKLFPIGTWIMGSKGSNPTIPPD